MAGEVYRSDQDQDRIEAALRRAEEQAADAARRMAPYWLAGAVQSVRQQAAAVQRRSVGRRMIDRIRMVLGNAVAALDRFLEAKDPARKGMKSTEAVN